MGGPTTMSDFVAALREERRVAEEAANELLKACENGDVEAFQAAMHRITVDGWARALPKLVRRGKPVSRPIQAAFQQTWIESKGQLSFHMGNHRIFCESLRVLLPPYRGRSMRLYRGTDMLERRRRIYGLSWSDDPAAAEDFARSKKHAYEGCEGGVLLETVAPPAAIISMVRYPKPLTEQEIAELRREHPNANINEYHTEREYVVDRGGLAAVTVMRRFLPS